MEDGGVNQNVTMERKKGDSPKKGGKKLTLEDKVAQLEEWDSERQKLEDSFWKEQTQLQRKYNEGKQKILLEQRAQLLALDFEYDPATGKPDVKHYPKGWLHKFWLRAIENMPCLMDEDSLFRVQEWDKPVLACLK
jgi:hypothetical protein